MAQVIQSIFDPNKPARDAKAAQDAERARQEQQIAEQNRLNAEREARARDDQRIAQERQTVAVARQTGEQQAAEAEKQIQLGGIMRPRGNRLLMGGFAPALSGQREKLG